MIIDQDFLKNVVKPNSIYPMLSIGGIIIVDDYSYWQGQQRAVDEFFTNISEDSIKKTIGSNYSLIIEKLR
jgi:signal peptidase I